MKTTVCIVLALACCAAVGNAFDLSPKGPGLDKLPIAKLLPDVPNLDKLLDGLKISGSNKVPSLLKLSFGKTSAGLDLSKLDLPNLLKPHQTLFTRITKTIASLFTPSRPKLPNLESVQTALVLAWMKEAGYYGLKELSKSLQGTNVTVTEFFQAINMTLAAMPASQADWRVVIPALGTASLKFKPSKELEKAANDLHKATAPIRAAVGGATKEVQGAVTGVTKAVDAAIKDATKSLAPKPSPKPSPKPTHKPKASPVPASPSKPKPKASPTPSPKPSPKPKMASPTPSSPKPKAAPVPSPKPKAAVSVTVTKP